MVNRVIDHESARDGDSLGVCGLLGGGKIGI